MSSSKPPTARLDRILPPAEGEVSRPPPSSSSVPPPRTVATGPQTPPPPFQVGALVTVASRTWPGINRPGGVGRVVAVRFAPRGGGAEAAAAAAGDDGDGVGDGAGGPIEVDVKYVLGGSERSIPAGYVEPSPQYDWGGSGGGREGSGGDGDGGRSRQPFLRNRGLLLGRCGLCGSLRRDCGRCDWAREEAEVRRVSGDTSSQPTGTSAASTAGRRRRARAGGRRTAASSTKPGGGEVRENEDDCDGDESFNFDPSDEDRKELIPLSARKRSYLHRVIDDEEEDSSCDIVAKDGPRDDGDSCFEDSDTSDESGIDYRDDPILSALANLSSLSSSRGRLERLHDGRRHRAGDDRNGTALTWATDLIDDLNNRSTARRRRKGTSLGGAGGSVIDDGKNRGDEGALHDGRRHRAGDDRNGTALTWATDLIDDLNNRSTAQRRRKGTSLGGAGGSVIDDGKNRGDEGAPVDKLERSQRRKRGIGLPGGELSALESASDVIAAAVIASTIVVDDSDVADMVLEEEGRAGGDDDSGDNCREDNVDGDVAAVASDYLDPLDETFIQPEGDEAAECLPSDIVDRTRSVPFADLPALFDNWADRIEGSGGMGRGGLLEDAAIEVERRRSGNNGEGEVVALLSSSSSDSLAEGTAAELHARLRQSLVRDGTDQLRAALHRLSDRGQYRAAVAQAKRRNGTDLRAELKRIRFARSGVVLDVREFRLDSVDGKVEALLHDLMEIARGHDITLDSGEVIGQAYSDGSGSENSGCDMSLDGEVDDNDRGVTVDDAPAKFGYIDPHPYATVVRKRRSSSSGSRASRQHHGDVGRQGRRRRRTDSGRSGRSGGNDSKGNGIAFNGGGPGVGGSSDIKEEVDASQIGACVLPRPGPSMSSCTDRGGSAPQDVNCPSVGKRHRRAGADISGSRGQGLSYEAVASSGFFDLGPTTTPAGLGPDVSARLDKENTADLSSSLSRTDRIKTASERMQSFLDANTSSTIDQYVSTRTPQTSLKRSHPGTGFANRSSGQTDRDAAASRGGDMGISVDDLYCSLVEWEGPNGSAASSLDGASADASSSVSALSGGRDDIASSTVKLCHLLEGAYPSQPMSCHSLLNRLGRFFRATTNESNCSASRRACKVAFGTVLDLMRLQGSATLLDLVSNATPKRAALHLKLLTFAVNLIANGANGSLLEEDGLVHRIFSPSTVRFFFDLICLQLIDVLYAQLLPEAWCTQSKISPNVRIEMDSLRDALGRAIPAIELVSNMLTSRFAKQEWASSRFADGSVKFITSVNPTLYETYLETGIRFEVAPDDVRYRLMKHTLPRREIDTIWGILAFFGHGTPVLSVQKYCWAVIQKLFFSGAGVFSGAISSIESVELAVETNYKSQHSHNYAGPSRAHMEAIRRDIDRLRTLVSSGALGIIPDMKKSGLLIKILRASFILQLESYWFNETSCSEIFPPVPNKTDMSIVSRLWDSTDLQLESETCQAIDTSFLTAIASLPTASSASCRPIFALTLSPSSALIRCCAGLVETWVIKSPDKKPRWIRLKKDLCALISDVEAGAKWIKSNIKATPPGPTSSGGNFEADFARAFPSASNDAPISQFSVAAAFLKEGAATLLLSLELTGVRLSSLLGPQLGESKPWIESVSHKISHILSDEAAKKIEPVNKEMTYPSQDLPSLLSTAKLYVGMVLLSLDNMPVEHFSAPEVRRKVLDQDEALLTAHTAMICSTLRSVCEHFNVANNFASFHKGVNFQVRNSQPDAALCARIVGCICTWLCSILCRARYILTQEETCVVPVVIRSIQHLGYRCLHLIHESLNDALVAATQSLDLGISSELCMRSCLALLRSAIALTHSTYHISCARQRNSAQENPSEPETSPSTDPDLFGFIDDDAFMDIDLEALTNCNQNQEIPNSRNQQNSSMNPDHQSDTLRQELSVITRGEVWSFFVRALEQSGPKPSIRYSASNYTGSAASPDKTSLSTHGRALCGRNAVGICSSLAALCSLRLEDDIELSSFGTLLQQHSSHSATDSIESITHSRHLAQCLSSEICRVAASFPSCGALITRNLKNTLGHLLAAMTDVDTLKEFPTINLRLLSSKGGSKSKAKEKELVLLQFDARRSKQNDSTSPDAEATGLMQDGKYVLPGPIYMRGSMWSFCKNLGKVMKQLVDEPNNKIWKLTGQVLVDLESSSSQAENQLYSGFLKKLGYGTMEKELLRRIIEIRNIFNVFLFSEGSQIYFSDKTTEIVTLTISSIIEQLFSVSRAVEYYGGDTNGLMESSDLHYEKAKVYVLQRCYGEFAAVVFSSLLYEIRSSQTCNLGLYLDIVRDQLIAPTLQNRQVNLCTIREQISIQFQKPIFHDKIKLPHLSFMNYDFCSNGGFPDDRSNISSKEFLPGIRRRINELVVYIANNKGDRCLLYAALMEAALLHDDGISSVLGCALAGIQKTFELGEDKQDKLQKAIDGYLFSVNSPCPHKTTQMNIRTLRQSALNKFILPKMFYSDLETKKKVTIVTILQHMLNSNTCHTQRDQFLINEVNEVGFLSLEVDVCRIAKALSFLLRDTLGSDKINDTLIEKIFVCANNLLHLPLKGSSLDDTILCWAASNKCIGLGLNQNVSKISLCGKYLWLFSTWLVELGILLQDHSTFLKVLHLARVAKKKNKSKWKPEYFRDFVHDRGCNFLELTNPMLVLATQHAEVEVLLFDEHALPVANVYTKKPSSEVSHIERSLIDETTLSLECINCVKKTISQFGAVG